MASLFTSHRIVDIASGLDHLLILTSNGRVYASAASHKYPDKGQLGVPGLTWATRLKGRPYDSPLLVVTAGNLKIRKIVTGDYHSVLLDSQGKVWTFGDNSYGQLGFEYNPDTPFIDTPTELLLQSLYPGGIAANCIDIAAGGANSFYMVDAVNLQDGEITADVWASGRGLWGELGNGKWTHVQGKPTKVKALSGLIECRFALQVRNFGGPNFNPTDDETSNSVRPIRIAYIAVGGSHIAAVLDNKTNTKSASRGSAFSGRDVLWWGNNEFCQLGNGKRNNMNVPSYFALLPFRRERSQVEPEGQQVIPTARLQVAPKQNVTLVGGREKEVEQRVVAGRGVSGIYSRV